MICMSKIQYQKKKLQWVLLDTSSDLERHYLGQSNILVSFDPTNISERKIKCLQWIALSAFDVNVALSQDKFIQLSLSGSQSEWWHNQPMHLI